MGLGACAALAVVGVACSGDGGDGDDGSAQASATVHGPTTSDWSPSIGDDWNYELRFRDEGDGTSVADVGAFALHVRHEPFRMWATDERGEFWGTVDVDDPADGGLWYETDGERRRVVSVGDLAFQDGSTVSGSCGPDEPPRDAPKAPPCSFADAGATATLSDGTSAHFAIAARGPHAIDVRLAPVGEHPAPGSSRWGMDLDSPTDEAIYGLTERIVDDLIDSEIVPVEAGTLDRRGEKVTMYVAPTISGYAPFFQTSRGYGLSVDGTMPGVYDLAATDPTALSLDFEIGTNPWASFTLIHGPGHPEILDDYTRLTGRPVEPPDDVFRHWRGRDVLPIAEPVDVDGVPLNASLASDLDAYARYDIPAGVYHFDRPWAVGQEGFGDLAFDSARFPDPLGMLELLDDRGWDSTVWVSPWAIGPRGEEAAGKGFLAPNSPRAIDLTNPEAVAWLKADLLEFLRSPEGAHIDGFFMDRGDEPDVTSTVDDVYADGRTGREIHNAYPALYAEIFGEVMAEARPDGDGFLIARPGYTGSQRHVLRWGGDTHSREGFILPEQPATGPSTDLGLRSVLVSMQRAAFMGTAYWGSDIGGYSDWTDREVYARWIEVGAFSSLMRFHGKGGTPWNTGAEPSGYGTTDDELLTIYRDYIELRHALVPYLAEAADDAHRRGMPLVRPLVFAWPDEPGARDRWDQWLLGPDLLVAPVWRSGDRTREVWIPPGVWMNPWSHDAFEEGPTTITVDVPLDQIPVFVRVGDDVSEALAPAVDLLGHHGDDPVADPAQSGG